MTDLRKAAEMALEACEHIHRTGDTQAFDLCYADKVIPALRQALAQPPCQTGSQCIGGKCPECERKWVGLTDEEIHEMIMGMRSRNMGVVMTEEIFRDVEAKLKEKNGG